MDGRVAGFVDPIAEHPLELFESIVMRYRGLVVLTHAGIAPLSVLLHEKKVIATHGNCGVGLGRLHPRVAFFLGDFGPEEGE